MWTRLAFFDQTWFKVWAGSQIQHSAGLGRGLLAGLGLNRKTRCLNSSALNLLAYFRPDSLRLSSFLWIEFCHCYTVYRRQHVSSHQLYQLQLREVSGIRLLHSRRISIIHLLHRLLVHTSVSKSEYINVKAALILISQQ